MEPEEILENTYKCVLSKIDKSVIEFPEIVSKVEFVCRSGTKAGIRFLLACSLAKSHNNKLDIRKPYSEIEGEDSYSGRAYDEQYIAQFINEYSLPCNVTTAFLTPAFRTKNVLLTTDVELKGTPKELYDTVLELLDVVYKDEVTAEKLLKETFRQLLICKNENTTTINTMVNRLKNSKYKLSSEAIITLIQQHLKCPKSSRLPVLVVVAAYKTAEEHICERVLPLQSHTAADKQTGALGDVEITLIDDDNIVTSYEMKTKRITKIDIDNALEKVTEIQIDNYIFITTEVIDKDVEEYATGLYDKTGGIEFVILDCIGFIRHFLHLFHRLRVRFLETYQELILEEPVSAVRQELKEAFLILRKAAETGEDLYEDY